MASVEAKDLLFKAIEKSLIRANKQIEKPGELWKEDIFRYIIVQELQKKRIWGKLAPDKNESPQLILEKNYPSRGNSDKFIDIVSWSTRSKKKHPLAVEVKAAKNGLPWKNFKLELERCKKLANSKQGNYYFDLVVMVQGGRITPRLSQLSENYMSTTKKSNVLIGFLKDGKPFVRWWHSTPVSSNRKSKPSPWKEDYNKPKSKSKAEAWRKAKKRKGQKYFSYNGAKYKIKDWKYNPKTNRLNRLK